MQELREFIINLIKNDLTLWVFSFLFLYFIFDYISKDKQLREIREIFTEEEINYRKTKKGKWT